MRNFLLSVAILLALLINGSLIYDLAASPQSSEVAIITQEIEKESPIKEEEKEKEPEALPSAIAAEVCFVAKEVAVQEQYCPSQGCNSGCYSRCNGSRWNYTPGQPVRNVVRFFHNRRPVRRFFGWIFRGRCW
jgi:hypothetical protein